MSEETEEAEKKEFEFNWKHFWIFVSIASVITAFVFVAYFKNFSGNFSNDQSVWGTFGDFIGGTLNPVLSFLAFIALLYTIIIQSKELKQATTEMNKSALALKEQSDSLKIQNFESTFFNLLKIHLDSVSKNNINKKIYGNDSYEIIFDHALNFLQTIIKAEGKYSFKLIDSYNQTLKEYKGALTLFFNQHLSLMDLIKTTTENKIEGFNPIFYTNIIRKQYTEEQTLLLFLAYLSNRMDEYKNILYKTLFFSNMDKKQVHGLNAELNKNNKDDDPNKGLDFIFQTYKEDDVRKAAK